MKNKLECPFCNEEIFTGLGKGCKMCGMVVNLNEKFCSVKCRKQYKKLNQKSVKGGK